ncbi:type I restriction enzyme HsdR N-terminal domain-containing protein [Treponema berlinense]|uniref:type I restriction enzyme HsdR N-terminal domain-containing protein n=1 Tax=Treponema berlinense TaxID=225004 RepID=UPI0026E95F25|nr:type I restriction enzyme HsdR N-terminal domain-containing protein [Treponema berlinense]
MQQDTHIEYFDLCPKPVCDGYLTISQRKYVLYECTKCSYTELLYNDTRKKAALFDKKFKPKVIVHKKRGMKMTNIEKWNEIVTFATACKNVPESVIQEIWEKTIFPVILCHEVKAQVAIKMGSAYKKMDIVIQKEGKDAIVVELKKHSLTSDEGQTQIFSYLNQLRTVKIGILVCDSLYIYDYDVSKSDEENDRNKLKISFKNDNPDGEKFVELFSKDNFSEEKIREFIQSNVKQTKDVEEIKSELKEEGFLRSVVEYYFSKTYEEATIEKALKDFEFSCKRKPETQDNNVDRKNGNMNENSEGDKPKIIFKISGEEISGGVFRNKLLEKKSAERKWFYNNGTIETDIWNASNFSETSSLLGNICSTNKYRNWKSTGLIRIEFDIN